MLLRDLEKVALEYAFARGKPFANSEFGKWVRHDLATEANKWLVFRPFELTVKSSVGAGNWAAVPWLAFFDPLITSSATQGFYVVYLVNAQTNEIYLSLNQGATEVYAEFGETKGVEVLKRRAIDMRERIPEFAKLFDIEEIDLGSIERLPRGYCAGHAMGRRYVAGEINDELFNRDLEHMLSAYIALVDRGGTLPSDAMKQEGGGETIEETRRNVLSRRIERAPSVRKRVLEKRGALCEGCGLDPQIQYSYRGPLKNTPLDVHHAKPLGDLAEGESRRYKVPDDFFILCPTCHRVIHSLGRPNDIDALRDSIKFGFKRKYS